MKMPWLKILRIVVLIALLFGSCPVASVQAAKKTKQVKKPARVSADSALLFEESGWHKYYARDINEKVLPASTTKVMTALLVLEKKNLDDIVVVSSRATNALPSKIDIKPGERYRVRDLLYAAILNSANDASVALAESVAGSEEKFVEMMNRRALQLGAKHTKFMNAHGLPTKRAQYTTAYDMFLIFRAALKKKFFREALKIKFMSIRSLDDRKISLKSHNKMLFKGWKVGVYGKTGYTNAAGACFVGFVQKKGKTQIIAVFNSPTRWDDIKLIIEKYGGIDL